MYRLSTLKRERGLFSYWPAFPSSFKFLLILTVLIPGLLFADIIIDNGQLGTTSTGTWGVSGGVGAYGVNSLWARDGATYTWSMNSQPAGLYEVSMWWTEYSSRGTAIPVQINYTGGSDTKTVNQQTDGGQWNVLGQYYFDGSGSVKLTANGAYPVSNCADAVQFVLVEANERPVAVINSILPESVEVGEEVVFDGDASDDGSIAAYEWSSSLDDIISTSLDFSKTDLSEGTHIITFRVQDDKGIWSADAQSTVTVGQASIPEVIIDNGDDGTTATGTWAVSGAADPYGLNSLWGRGGSTYSWSATSLVPGTYEVFMWWTEFSSRSNAVTILIDNADGQDSYIVNQQTDGGQWNSLGTYTFDTTGTVTLLAPGVYPTSYSADAVRFVKAEPAPVVAGFTATPTSGDMPLNVSFTDTSSGTGVIDSWQWDFDNDGFVDSTEQNPSYVYSAAGLYSVSLIASGPDGSDEIVKTDYIEVLDPNAGEELIIDNGQTGTTSTGDWEVSGGADPYGSNSLWARETATYRWSFTPEQGGSYQVSLWWTEFTSRGEEVPVVISHRFGTTNKTVNQKTNGGMWNGLGTYVMDAGETYYVEIATPGTEATASADAAYFKRVSVDNIPPNATIVKVDPSPLLITQQVTLEGNAVDVDGTVEEYLWESDLDGFLSSDITTTVSLTEGIHTISFSARDDHGDWSSVATKKVVVLNSSEIEHVYACFGYGSERVNFHWEEFLNDIAAIEIGDLWIYTNPVLDKSYVIHTVKTIEGMHNAMKVQDSHILFYGHSNYGAGAIFPTDEEQGNQIIEELYYMDDDRMFNYSSDTVAVSISGMINSQAYPNWYPVFKNGSSAIAPYNFGDPAGDPPYNYYITYQIPGDPNYYRVDSPRESPLQRFPDSYTPAWYRMDGTKPDPNIASDRQYYITNSNTWIPPFENTTGWTGSTKVLGYYGPNYLWTDAGSGEEVASWTFTVPSSDQYIVSARWPASSGRTDSAPYTVVDVNGAHTIEVNQKINGATWNSLGTFDFVSGVDYSVTLTNDTASGNVIADAVRIAHVLNPPDVLQADFYSIDRSGDAPLEVRFTNQSTGATDYRTWNFGDGTASVRTTNGSIVHTYTNPGYYTVTMTVNGAGGTSSITKTNYVAVSTGTTPLQPEFSAGAYEGSVPRTVYFRDRTSGSVKSRLWDFGDGRTSTDKDPIHTYSNPGNYDVTLTVTFYNDQVKAMTKPNFVRAVVYEKMIDNINYPQRHYGSKTILKRGPLEIDPAQMKYKRMFILSCNSGVYYLQTLGRGIMFYSLDDTEVNPGTAFSAYLRPYMMGQGNDAMLEALLDRQAAFDYYDFNKKPEDQ